MRIRELAAIFVIPVCAAIAGCGGAGSVDAHLKRGDALSAEGKHLEALVDYKAAVQVAPNSGPARRKLGEAYLAVNDAPRAVAEFVRAADLMPTDMELQLQAANMLLLTGRFDDARSRADKVLTANAANVDAQIIKGNALAGLKDFQGAMKALEAAVATDPTRGSGYGHLAALQFARGDVQTAESTFKRAIAADPKSVSARLALANLYWSTGNVAEAERVIREAIALQPRNVVTNRGLAFLLLGLNRFAEAEAPLKVVAEESKGADGRINLADYYMNTSRTTEARAIYEGIAASSDFLAPTAKLRLAALGLLHGGRAEANRLIDEVLAKEPRHVEALIARAQLQFEDGKTAEALSTARQAVAVAPQAPMGHFLVGRIQRAEYQTEEAEAAFKEASRVSPAFAPAQVELARLALVAGKYEDAASYAQAAIQQVPGLGDGHLLLARSRLASGDVNGAEQSLRLMDKHLPDSPIVKAEIGRLQLARGDSAGARASFSAALAKDPLNVSALEGFIALELREGKKDAARQRLDQAVAAAPAASEVQIVAARLYVSSFSDLAAAEKTVRRALEANSKNLDGFALLARIHIQRGDLPAATREFEELARKQPRSIANRTALGLLYHLQGKLDNAKATYEQALSIDSRAPVAANNLAQLLSDRNENLDAALELAKSAKRELPKSHEVDDTLGWLYYKKNLPFMAIAPLRAAVAAQPDNAVYLYHLGAAYALNKDKVNARQNLEKALKRGAFAGAEDARRVLDSLK